MLIVAVIYAAVLNAAPCIIVAMVIDTINFVITGGDSIILLNKDNLYLTYRITYPITYLVTAWLIIKKENKNENS